MDISCIGLRTAVLDLSCIGLRMAVLDLSCIGLKMAVLVLLRANAAIRIGLENGCIDPEAGFAKGQYSHPKVNTTDLGPVTGSMCTQASHDIFINQTFNCIFLCTCRQDLYLKL